MKGRQVACSKDTDCLNVLLREQPEPEVSRLKADGRKLTAES